MPSPRSRFETACRIGAFGVLGWLLGGSVIPPSSRRLEQLGANDVAARLPALTRAAGMVGVHVAMPATPASWVVDWLNALQASGRPVSWSGAPPAVAMSVAPSVDPDGGERIDVAAPAGSIVALRDDASAIDSVRVSNLGGSVETPIAVGTIRGDVRGQSVSARAGDSLARRAVLVVGAAGWEGKYIVSALEERGWPVIARFSIAPNVDVTEGIAAQGAVTLDTSRIAAVIAIDSTVGTLGPSLDRFVRSGGGLVLAGTAAASPSVARLVAGGIAPRTRPNVRPTDTVRLGSTGFYPVAALREDGVALERRPEGIAVAARRVGAGRVVQVGYDDTWRWRMAGAAGAEAAHRAWWSRVAGAVAFLPGIGTSGATMAESAPVAALVDRLGPPRAAAPAAPGRPIDRRILMILMMILLLAEWTSRRLRGMR